MSVQKAGAVFQREIRQWFDPTDAAHVLAFFVYEQTGQWPPGFITGDVWMLDNGWQAALRTAIDAVPLPAEVRRYMAEYHRLLVMVGDLLLEPFGGTHFLLRVREGGRPWLVEQGESEEAVLQTCLLAKQVDRLSVGISQG